MRVAALCVALLTVVACSLDEGPLMDPGQDCLGCHSGGGEANRWTVAGTWSRGAHITVTDANGKTVPMRGNKVGNFYTAESLKFPIRVSVDGEEMGPDALPSGGGLFYGGCNLCHAPGGEALFDANAAEGAPKSFALMAPGRDCIGCHNPAGIAWNAPYTIAGSWRGPGHVITVIDRDGTRWDLPTNAAGNFYTKDRVDFPLQTIQVDGEDMEADEVAEMTHASCNVCHGNGGEGDD